jgi:hypothetical protein
LSVNVIEEHIFRRFESKMLRRLFGPKRKDVARQRRKLYKE